MRIFTSSNNNNNMKTLDIITKTRIQSRVEQLVINSDAAITLAQSIEAVTAEFGDTEEVKVEATKQYKFMMEF